MAVLQGQVQGRGAIPICCSQGGPSAQQAAQHLCAAAAGCAHHERAAALCVQGIDIHQGVLALWHCAQGCSQGGIPQQRSAVQRAQQQAVHAVALQLQLCWGARQQGALQAAQPLLLGGRVRGTH